MYGEEVVVAGTLSGTGDVRVDWVSGGNDGVSTTTAKFRVGRTELQVLESLSENYVVRESATDPDEAGDYRFGYNGKMNENEIAGKGNSMDFNARSFDPRIARFTSVDPWAKKYPYQGPYSAFNNNPIYFVDPTGKGGVAYSQGGGSAPVTIRATVYVYSTTLNPEIVSQQADAIRGQLNYYWNNPSTLNTHLFMYIPQRATVNVDGADVPAVYIFDVKAVTVDEAKDYAKTPDQLVNFVNLFSGNPSSPFETSYTEGNCVALNINQNTDRNGTSIAHEFGHVFQFHAIIPLMDLANGTGTEHAVDVPSLGISPKN